MANILLDAFYSLSKRINKFGGQEIDEVEQGPLDEELPELTLAMPNDELIKLTESWENQWLTSETYSKWKKHWEENESYYLGTHFDIPEISPKKAVQDNVLFQALETYLPQVTQHNPEPLVTLGAGIPDPQGTGQAFAQAVKLKLADLADELRLRLKLKKGARHWAIYLVGAAKMSWDGDHVRPGIKIVRPQKLILDPDGCTDEDGYDGRFIGEHRSMSATDMVAKLLEFGGGEDGAIQYVVQKAGGQENLGTEMGFVEWWTKEYFCWVMSDRVLFKSNNPNWNYPKAAPGQQMPGQMPAPMPPQTPEMPQGGENPGETTQNEGETPQTPPQQPQAPQIPGLNHFATKKMPYLLLSVFNLGKAPVDDTSLFTQSLPLQDLINRRIKQIDKNAASMNGGMVVAGDRSGLSQRQATTVTRALRNGGTIWIPTGPVNEAIARMAAPPLPDTVYQQLNDTRMRLQLLFGTEGFEPVTQGGLKAVRTQMINMQLDQARISGGFSEYLEQWADDAYNWMLQLLYVHDPEYKQFQNPPKVKVTVKEGSLLPKDSVALANQAMNLAKMGRIATVDLFKQLELPNPEELAANAWLEVNAPELLYGNNPLVAQALQMKAQAGQKPPSETISFKDLPPDGKAQMAQKAGITLHPEGIAAHDEFQRSQEQSNPGQESGAPQNNAPQQ